MNTIGKILVVLNFVFAVLVGGLLVYDFSARTRWRDAYEQLKREADVLKQARDATSVATGNISADFGRAQFENRDLKQKLKDTEEEMKVKVFGKDMEIADLKFKAQDADLSLRETLKAKQRLVEEIALLKDTVKDREKSIVSLEADNKSLRVVAVTNEGLARTRQEQNELLLEQVRELTQRLIKVESGPTTLEGLQAISNPNAPNPPAVKVSGIIEKVDAKDGTLVEISLGTDHGVNKNNTLDVFRLRPDAKYLGMIRIVEAYHHRSVGRLVGTGNPALRPQLKQGDQVASKIN